MALSRRHSVVGTTDAVRFRKKYVENPIYQNVPAPSSVLFAPADRIYQNMSEAKVQRRSSQIQRTDSSLKRRIARTQSERRLSYQPPSENIVRQFDYDKLGAVLRFMEAHNIDPYVNNQSPTYANYSTLEREPKHLRRIRSEKDLGQMPVYDSARAQNHVQWYSSERVPKEKKKRRSLSFSFRKAIDDIEYGPGIVEKLKAKFYQLSGIASREAKVSPHATGKRCPSVDDILSATEQPSPTWENQPNVANSLHKAYSKSMGDVFDSTPEKRSFVVHRAARIGDEDEEDELQPISVLRKKFEQNVQRRPSQNRRNSQGFTTKLAHRPKSVDFSEHDSMLRNLSTPRSFTVLQSSESCSCQIPVSSCRQESVDSYRALPKITSPLFSSIQDKDSCHSADVLDETSHPTIRKDVSHLRVLEVLNHREPDDEPEFVKIGRRLKRSPLHLDDMPETIELKKDIIENNPFVSPRSETSADHGVVYRSYNPTMRTAQSQQIEHDYTEETRKYIVRASPDVPIITSNTKIVRESENSRAFETYSPPDPQPAKYASISSDIVIMASPEVRYSSDSSPPPEEPKPRMKADNSPVIEKFSTPQHFNKSDNRATVQEMLHRFQKKSG